MKQHTLAFVGTGNMARCLITGLVTNGYDPQHIWASNPSPEKLNALQQQFGIHITQDNKEAVQHADVIVFTVKPNVLPLVTQELSTVIQEKSPLVISVAAGIRIHQLQHHLNKKTAIVRCMPNTPALVGSGATALYANENVSNEQKNIAESILRAVGLTVWLNDEKLLDIVTALSGSGPAYFLLIMEILEKAATELGLPAETAQLLTVQTALGAARVALESQNSIAALREQVTSPGGTTAAAIETLEAGHIRDLFSTALEAAEQQAEKIAEMNDISEQ